MKNCLVAQSGGPTCVINASAVGVLSQNNESKIYNKVFAGINGIEGILAGRIVAFDEKSINDIDRLKLSPSSGLGSCRFKMKNYKDDDSDYKKLFEIFKEKEIETFFYIGGNDSMDTVNKLSKYAKENNLATKIIGVPKTIDNDLMETDHTPGFGSAAKLISTITLETYLDSCIYSNNGIFILETMGRDTGWLAASSCLAKINGKAAADLIYLPETSFNKDEFLNDVEDIYKRQNRVFIVASEGIRDKDSKFIAEVNADSNHDIFGHAQLGGVCGNLKNMIIERGITSRIKTLELGVIQRSSLHCGSKTDIDEAYNAGKTAVKCSVSDISGKMVSIQRISSSPYKTEFTLVDTDKVANRVKYFPKEWINEKQNGITEEAFEYFTPLIQDDINIKMKNGLPDYTALFL